MIIILSGKCNQENESYNFICESNNLKINEEMLKAQRFFNGFLKIMSLAGKNKQHDTLILAFCSKFFFTRIHLYNIN